MADSGQTNSKKVTELDAYIQKGIELWKPPGLAVTVVKDGEIIIQGNYREQLIKLLSAMGHHVKRVGG